MNDTVIKCENISKRYRLGTDSRKDKTFAGRLLSSFRTPLDNFKRLTRLSKFNEDDETVFWALKDISFDAKRGEVLGIIGRNGAGKSTLLKILSRITDPTTGHISISGRVASLLEVGTGFHPELTGRENVFMNGTILGMRRKEINLKFEEIVEFSGISKFIDTPVKFYSSGMKVRLGFAVAAHLEPEILIVDEVLAVGDIEFQNKCLGKMDDVSKKEGRTVLFVSHNMAAVQNLCSSAILLENGRISARGPVTELIKSYLNNYYNQSRLYKLSERSDRQGNGAIKFEDAWFENTNGERVDTLFSGMSAVMAIDMLNTARESREDVIVSVGIDDSHARRLTVFSNELTNQRITFQAGERKVVKIIVNTWPFQADDYYFTLFSSVRGEVSDWIFNAGKFTVESGDYFKTGRLPQRGQGSILIHHTYL